MERFLISLVAALAILWTLMDQAESKERVVAGVLGNQSGQWFVLNDQYHKPKGIHAVFQTSNSIVVHYDFTAQFIRAFVVSPDEAYAGDNGLTCGASVGLYYAVLRCTMPGHQGPVDPATLVNPVGNIWIYGVLDDGEQN